MLSERDDSDAYVVVHHDVPWMQPDDHFTGRDAVCPCNPDLIDPQGSVALVPDG